MEKEFRKGIEKLLKCPKGFKCLDDNSKNLCKTRNLGLAEYLECLEKEPLPCPFALSFGGRYFCQCPLRMAFAKKQGKAPSKRFFRKELPTPPPAP